MIFFVLYIGIILSYPVLDSRFFYPVFLLFLLWLGSTLSYLRQLNNRIINFAIGGLVVILLLPNFVWTINFIDTQHRINNDPLGTFLDSKDSTVNTRHFQIVLPLAGDWLNKQNDSSDVVISPYKELAFYLNQKKVFGVDRNVSTSGFNQAIQDYDVQYVVLLKDIIGWRDYEMQFNFNDRYSFTMVFDSGAVEVYKILPKIILDRESGNFSLLFSKIKNRNYKAADEFFTQNRTTVNYHADLLSLNIINKQYQGQMDSVSKLLERFYTKSQGFSYTSLASIHQTLIGRRALLDKMPLSDFRSRLLLNLGMTYWQIDMKDVALKYYQQCIDEDSTVALAYVFKIVFSFQAGDTAAAIKMHHRLRSVFPNAELADKIDSLMHYQSSYRKSVSLRLKAESLENIFDLYQSLGLTIPAREVGKKILLIDPSRISVYKKLGILYEKENEYYPALKNLNRYTLQNRNDSTVDARINDLKRKLYLQ